MSRVPHLLKLLRSLAALLAILAMIGVGGLPAARAAGPSVVYLTGLETHSAPAIEDFKGRLYIAAAGVVGSTGGPTNPIYITSVEQEGANPAGWSAIPGLTSPSALALKVFRKRLYLAARDEAGQLSITSSKDGKQWADWAAVPLEEGMTVTAAPAMKVFKNRLYVAVRTDEGSIAISSTRNGRTWTEWREVPDSTTDYAPALTQFEGKLLLGFTGTDGLVYLTRSGNGKRWSEPVAAPDWGPDPSTDPTIPRPVASAGPGLTVLDGLLYVGARVREFDSEPNLNLATFDGDEWSPWAEIGPSMESEPALTTFAGQFYASYLAWSGETLVLLFNL